MKRHPHLLAAICLFTLAACNNNDSAPEQTTEKKDSTTFSITEQGFGKYGDEAITQYTLTNPAGMQVKVINYGGTITDIITADKNGNRENVILGFDSLSGYLQKANPYFNALIGRYGNRIANARFQLDGKTYTLAANDNGNTLHGGLKGYDKVVWKASKPAGDSSLQLTYLSKDGEEGYPGNLNITVVYTLTAANELKIDYSAQTDKATPVNLTSHCYFNLSGGKDSNVLAHDLSIKADRFTQVDAKLIPTGELAEVKGGPMDFNTTKPVGRDIAQVKGGYDHNWVLTKAEGLANIATLYHPGSGRAMDVLTTEPGLQFYSGNFLDGTLANTRGGARYGKHAGLCLETQHYPDSPNQPSFPTTTLEPGKTYHQLTIYKFYVK